MSEPVVPLRLRCGDCYEFGHEECGCGECGAAYCGSPKRGTWTPDNHPPHQWPIGTHYGWTNGSGCPTIWCKGEGDQRHQPETLGGTLENCSYDGDAMTATPQGDRLDDDPFGRRWVPGQPWCTSCHASGHRYTECPVADDDPTATAARRPLRVNGKPIPPEIANGSPGDFARFCGETDPDVLALLDAEADDGE